MKLKHLLVLCTFLLSSAYAIAQERTVTGTVTSAEDGLPIIGATILIKGTNTGTTTDFDGKYEISVADENAVLVFSYTGMEEQEIQVGAQSTIDLVMQIATALIDEIVVVGYGSQKKSVVTGSISSINAEDLENLPTLRVEQALQGRTAGVQVIANNGQPGEALSVRIRGAGTTGNADPLYVVDGFPVGGIDYLNPGDIESIEVLKDAASAAIYGARAANGVVLITTKSGTEGNFNVSYDGYYGIQSPWRQLAMLNATEYALIQNEAHAASNLAVPFDDPRSFGEGTYWQDEIYNNNVPMMNHQLSVTGGNSKSNFAATMSYFTQEGIVGGDKSQFDRYTARINSTHKIGSALTFGENFSYSHIYRRSIDGNSEFGGPLMNALNMDPITNVYEDDPAVLATYDPLAVRDANGRVYAISEFATQEVLNPLANLERQNQEVYVDKIVGNVFGELEMLPGLKFRTTFGLDMAYVTNNSFTPEYFLNAAQVNRTSRVNKSIDRFFNWLWENTLSYTTKINQHDISALVGTTAQEFNFENIGGAREDVVFDNFENAFLNTAINQETATIFGGASENALFSYFGRVTYSFADKYLFTGVLRVDGSSRFGANTRYGTFPAVSAGWVLSQEDFFNVDFIDFAKVRVSWGQNGNQEIGNYRWASTISTLANYTYGDGTLTTGAIPSAVANPDLEWETSEQTNIGIDLRFLDGRLTLTTDYYVKETIGLLLDAPIPGIVGNNAPTVNGGNVENRGVEFELGYRNKAGSGINYNVSFNFSYNENEVTAINNAEGVLVGAGFSTYGVVSRAEVGFPIGYFWGLKTNGLFQNQAEVEGYTNADGGLIQPDAAPGDIRFVDLNNDGVIDDSDRTIIGNPTPQWTYGFNFGADYKNFDLNLFIQGAAGNELFNGTRRHDLTSTNMPARFLNRWTGEGTSNDIPRATISDPNGNFSKISDFYIESGDFVRLRDVQLGYTFPSSLLNKFNISKLRLYVAAQNLLTLTNYNGFDPEIGGGTLGLGIDRGVYPQARAFRFGLNVVF
ncbi:MAG: TonB-dependent receptor [Bacteroidota bacterium]